MTLSITKENLSLEDDTEDQSFFVTSAQAELNDLVCDLNLPKDSAKLLAFGLKENHLLENNVPVTFYLCRHNKISFFFTKEEELVYVEISEEFLINLTLKNTNQPNGNFFYI